VNVRSLALAAAAVAGAALAVPAPAQAAPLCFGPPSIPAAYVCYTPGLTGAPEVRNEGATATVPSICYGVGCTEDVTEPVPSVYLHTRTIGAGYVTYMGTDYPVGVNNTLTLTLCEAFDTNYVHCVS
jgi:hypothetical protein